MKNEEIIRNKIGSSGFIKMKNRDTWTKDSWTIRIIDNDIEIFDDIEKTGYYILGHIKIMNPSRIDNILEEINKLIN